MIDSVLLKWDFKNIILEEGLFFGVYVDKEMGEIVYV